MQRNLSTLIAVIAFAGFAATGFADEAQPELQPKRLEMGWFKKPVESTTYEAPRPAAVEGRDYRVVTDFSPL